jgi:cytochrome c
MIHGSNIMKSQLISTAMALVALALSSQSYAAAPPPVMKKSGCANCHSLDKKKVGPSYKETAAKYKGDAGAAAKLHTHLTTNPKVMVDGKEEAHASLKTTNDDDVKAVVTWILAQ